MWPKFNVFNPTTIRLTPTNLLVLLHVQYHHCPLKGRGNDHSRHFWPKVSYHITSVFAAPSLCESGQYSGTVNPGRSSRIHLGHLARKSVSYRIVFIY